MANDPRYEDPSAKFVRTATNLDDALLRIIDEIGRSDDAADRYVLALVVRSRMRLLHGQTEAEVASFVGKMVRLAECVTFRQCDCPRVKPYPCVTHTTDAEGEFYAPDAVAIWQAKEYLLLVVWFVCRAFADLNGFFTKVVPLRDARFDSDLRSSAVAQIFRRWGAGVFLNDRVRKSFNSLSVRAQADILAELERRVPRKANANEIDYEKFLMEFDRSLTRSIEHRGKVGRAIRELAEKESTSEDAIQQRRKRALRRQRALDAFRRALLDESAGNVYLDTSDLDGI